MARRAVSHRAAVSGLCVVVTVLTGCGTTQDGDAVSDQSWSEVSARTRALTTELVEGAGEITAPFRDSRSVCSDDPDAISPVSFVHRGGLRTAGPARPVLDDIVRRSESDGWVSSRNGTFTNLDRDGYRVAMRIGDSGMSLTVTGTSPCVEVDESDASG